MSVSLDNTVRVSVSAQARGLVGVNTSALAVVTDDDPTNKNFGDGKVYLDPSGVEKDFGSNSETYKLVNAIYSQGSNVLKGGGYVVV